MPKLRKKNWDEPEGKKKEKIPQPINKKKKKGGALRAKSNAEAPRWGKIGLTKRLKREKKKGKRGAVTAKGVL